MRTFEYKVPTLDGNIITRQITYAIFGHHKPATREHPPEYPEIDILSNEVIEGEGDDDLPWEQLEPMIWRSTDGGI